MNEIKVYLRRRPKLLPAAARPAAARLEDQVPVVDHEWIASFLSPDGADCNGAGETKADALMNAVLHWKRWQFARSAGK